MKKTRTIATILFCAMLALGSRAGELKRLDNATLVEARWNDGDSFIISHAGEELTIRLYYVDCPETTASSAVDARRVREQTRYFGLSGHDRTVHNGREAASFTRDRLQKPFTVHTAYATAQGRSVKKRYYAFVTTADGQDLAHLLVKHGYARCHGTARALPDGTPRKQAAAQLSDIELSAVLDRRGIWAEAESSRLIALRKAARKEAEELAQIARDAAQVYGKVNINTASAQELQTIHGIGPKKSQRIIEHRPFSGPDDLTRVPGIASKTVTNILYRITFV
jgi:competence protein ComEA